MRHDPVNPTLFQENRARLISEMKPESIAIVMANDVLPTNADGTMPYAPNSDLYYLTGVAQEETVLVLYPDAPKESQREILFVRETSEQLAIWEGEKLSKKQATEVSGITNVQWTESFESVFHGLAPLADTIYLATNEHLRAENIVETRSRRFIETCQKRYPLHEYERLSPHLNHLRMVKEKEEIRQIQTAVDITAAGFERVLKFVKPGVGEWEIEAEFLHEFIRRRSRGFAYQPIVASGERACILHYIENRHPCQDGELILMDVAAEYAGWNADMTRTIPVNGRYTKRQREVYEAVLRVMRAANDLLRPGILIADYQKETVNLMEKELVDLGLISAEEARAQDEGKPLVKKYFMHGTSHHLGLDVHDVSDARVPIAEGMVLTIEPGIYIREEGIGVRLENDVVIGSKTNQDLFENVPIEIEEIEDLMNS